MTSTINRNEINKKKNEIWDSSSLKETFSLTRFKLHITAHFLNYELMCVAPAINALAKEFSINQRIMKQSACDD